MKGERGWRAVWGRRAGGRASQMATPCPGDEGLGVLSRALLSFPAALGELYELWLSNNEISGVVLQVTCHLVSACLAVFG